MMEECCLDVSCYVYRVCHWRWWCSIKRVTGCYFFANTSLEICLVSFFVFLGGEFGSLMRSIIRMVFNSASHVDV